MGLQFILEIDIGGRLSFLDTMLVIDDQRIIFDINIHGSFLYKDYAFRGFLPCPDPFLEYQRFVKVLFTRARSNQILSCSFKSLLLYITLLGVGEVQW